MTEDGAETGGGDTPASPLQLLLLVQDEDLRVDQLAYRRRELAERHALAELERRADDLAARRAEIAVEQSRLSDRQNEIESQVASFGSRIAAIEARMRQGGDYRDVQAMSSEADSLVRHRRSLEDVELEVMEQLEPVESELAAIDAQLSSIGADRLARSSALEQAEAALDTELAAVLSKRAELAAGLPAPLAATYERLRSHLGGIGAARLVDGACSGCHLKLPSSERDRVVHAAAGEVSYCDQCGRILVP